jgi:outer membrane lipoprotein-sorting protein
MGLVASGATKETAHDDLIKIKVLLRRYQLAKAVKVELKKTVKLALLDEEKNSEGNLILSNGRLKLEILKPEPSTVIVNKNLIWVISPTSKDLGGKTQVMKISSSSLKKQAKAPLAILIGRPSAWDQFKVESKTEDENTAKYVLKPKDPKEMNEMVVLKITVDKKNVELRDLSYSDDLDNETRFDFKAADFKVDIKDDAFDYVPPKNAELTEYK